MKRIIASSILFFISDTCAADKPVLPSLSVVPQTRKKDDLPPTPRHILFENPTYILEVGAGVIGCRPYLPNCVPTPLSLMADGKSLRAIAETNKVCREVINTPFDHPNLRLYAGNFIKAVCDRGFQVQGSSIPHYAIAALLNTKGLIHYIDQEKNALMDDKESVDHKTLLYAQFIEAYSYMHNLSVQDTPNNPEDLLEQYELVKRAGKWGVFFHKALSEARISNKLLLKKEAIFFVDYKEFLHAYTNGISELQIDLIKQKPKPILSNSVPASPRGELPPPPDDLFCSINEIPHKVTLHDCERTYSALFSESMPIPLDFDKGIPRILVTCFKRASNHKVAFHFLQQLEGKGHFDIGSLASDPELVSPIVPYEVDFLQEPVLYRALWHKCSLYLQGVDQGNLFVIKFNRNESGIIANHEVVVTRAINGATQDSIGEVTIDAGDNVYVGNPHTFTYAGNLNGGFKSWQYWFRKIFSYYYNKGGKALSFNQ